MNKKRVGLVFGGCIIAIVLIILIVVLIPKNNNEEDATKPVEYTDLATEGVTEIAQEDGTVDDVTKVVIDESGSTVIIIEDPIEIDTVTGNTSAGSEGGTVQGTTASTVATSSGLEGQSTTETDDGFYIDENGMHFPRIPVG